MIDIGRDHDAGATVAAHGRLRQALDGLIEGNCRDIEVEQPHDGHDGDIVVRSSAGVGYVL